MTFATSPDTVAAAVFKRKPSRKTSGVFFEESNKVLFGAIMKTQIHNWCQSAQLVKKVIKL
jgi:hypothetical protein